MAKDPLLAYKTALARPIDLEDIEQLTGGSNPSIIEYYKKLP